MKLNRFTIYTWVVLGFNVLVILWGAFVRVTGSGAGCGSHWPSCNGEIIPWGLQTETLIEFIHRLTSGLALVFIVILLVWAFQSYPKRHPVRLGATLSMIFIVIEALIGAVLVLFELVAYDTSIARALVIAGHLVNTYLLLGVLTLTAWWASGGKPIRLKNQGWLGWSLGIGLLGMLLLGASGALAALGNLLFPVSSLAEGIRQDFSPTAHFLIRLRIGHPFIAIGLGAYVILIMGVFNTLRPTSMTRRIAKTFTIIYLIQLLGGALNVVLLAPVWMQLFHLLMSDLIVVTLVLFMSSAFVPETLPVSAMLKTTPKSVV